MIKKVILFVTLIALISSAKIYRTRKCDSGASAAVKWGEKTCATPEYYKTSDITTAFEDKVKAAIKVASATWGNYGPLEVYMVGRSQEAAKVLEDSYCTRHKSYDTSFTAKASFLCPSDNNQMFRGYSTNQGAAVSYVKLADVNYDFLTITYSYQDAATSVVMHEYFHVYQQSHVLGDDQNVREAKLGGKGHPWIMEGHAEFFGQTLYSQQSEADQFKSYGGWLKYAMTDKLLKVRKITSTKLVNEFSYTDEYAYDIATWFAAYLVHHEGETAVRVNFYDDLQTLGFDCSFQKNFGLTPTAYVAKFHEWLKANLASDEKMLAILGVKAASLRPTGFVFNQAECLAKNPVTKASDSANKGLLINISINTLLFIALVLKLN